MADAVCMCNTQYQPQIKVTSCHGPRYFGEKISGANNFVGIQIWIKNLKYENFWC